MSNRRGIDDNILPNMAMRVESMVMLRNYVRGKIQIERVFLEYSPFYFRKIPWNDTTATKVNDFKAEDMIVLIITGFSRCRWRAFKKKRQTFKGYLRRVESARGKSHIIPPYRVVIYLP